MHGVRGGAHGETKQTGVLEMNLEMHGDVWRPWRVSLENPRRQMEARDGEGKEANSMMGGDCRQKIGQKDGAPRWKTGDARCTIKKRTESGCWRRRWRCRSGSRVLKVQGEHGEHETKYNKRYTMVKNGINGAQRPGPSWDTD